MSLKLRRDPRLVREVLAHVEQHGPWSAVAKYDLSSRTVYRWVRAREAEGSQWPTDADVDEWIAAQPRRRRQAAQHYEYRKRCYLNRGPLLVDALGTARRVQALYALGWTSVEIAERVSFREARVQQLAKMLYPKVQPHVAQQIAEVYDALSMVTPTDEPGKRCGMIHARQRRWAARLGYAPPLAWDDIDTDPAPTGVRESDELTRRRVTRADLDQHACPRCGVMRQARTSDALCIDCRVVEEVAS